MGAQGQLLWTVNRDFQICVAFLRGMLRKISPGFFCLLYLSGSVTGSYSSGRASWTLGFYLHPANGPLYGLGLVAYLLNPVDPFVKQG